MFSKALFKQSCKANRTMWTIITAAVCFMLACVMLITGGGNIAEIRYGIQDTIVKSEIDALVSKQAMNYANLTEAALNEFDKYFGESMVVAQGDPTAAYGMAAQKLQAYAKGIANEKGYAEDSDEAKEIMGVIFYALNPAGQYNDFYTSHGEEPLTFGMETFGTENRTDYISDFSAKTASIFLAGNMSSDETVDKMVEKLENYHISREKYDSFGYTYENLKHSAVTSILEYQSRFAYEVGELDKTAPDFIEKATQLKETLITESSATFLSTLPQEVSDALEEIGGMDLYDLVVGSIFYKMAGLLLPIIYVIMVANSLIAGQVDSGSMAYVLSTSTKRRQVTFTQAAFLVSSIFAMICCTTVTSMICLAIVKTDTISLTYAQLAYMNLGAFCVLFAVGGVCFLASAWFNRSKDAMGIGGGISMFFLVATMLGLFGSPVLPSIVRLKALNYFNYVSIISLFDVVSIIDGTWNFLPKLAILIVGGLICYIIGSERFAKKDLPL